MVRGMLRAGSNPGMTVFRVLAYQTGPRAKLEPDRDDRAWCSTTVLPSGVSGRDRLLSQCVLRRRAWFRAQKSVDRKVAASLPSMGLLVARAGYAELDRYPQPMVAWERSAPMPDPVWTYQLNLTSCMAYGICRWIT